MPINSFHDALPTNPGSRDGWRPDDTSVLGSAFAGWLAANSRPRTTGERSYVRPSDALSCARRVSYVAAGREGTPMEPSGLWVTTLGTNIHEMLGAAVRDAYPDAELETAFDGPVDVDGTEIHVKSYVDLVIPSLSLATDFKSVGGFAYKMAVGDRGAPEGPKREHLIQAGIGALLTGMENVSVLYLARDAISVAVAKRKGFDEIRRFAAEWTVPLESIRADVVAELNRLWGITRLWNDERTLAARKVPGVPSVIDAPRDGSWAVRELVDNPEGSGEPVSIITATGNYWGCGYCPFQQDCITDGAGRVRIEEGVADEQPAD